GGAWIVARFAGAYADLGLIGLRAGDSQTHGGHVGNPGAGRACGAALPGLLSEPENALDRNHWPRQRAACRAGLRRVWRQRCLRTAPALAPKPCAPYRGVSSRSWSDEA